LSIFPLGPTGTTQSPWSLLVATSSQCVAYDAQNYYQCTTDPLLEYFASAIFQISKLFRGSFLRLICQNPKWRLTSNFKKLLKQQFPTIQSVSVGTMTNTYLLDSVPIERTITIKGLFIPVLRQVIKTIISQRIVGPGQFMEQAEGNDSFCLWIPSRNGKCHAQKTFAQQSIQYYYIYNPFD
jgi:hypothetical protein